MNITYAELLAHLREYQGSVVKTIGRRSSFSWELLESRVEFILENKKKRKESLSWVKEFCILFNQKQSFIPSDYTKERNSSYMLGLVRDVIKKKNEE